MKYLITNAAFGSNRKTIETETKIEELIENSKTGFIKLKDGNLIGVDLLKSSFIEIYDDSKSMSASELAGHFR